MTGICSVGLVLAAAVPTLPALLGAPKLVGLGICVIFAVFFAPVVSRQFMAAWDRRRQP